MKITYPKLAQTMKNLMKLDDGEIISIKERLADSIETIAIHINDRKYFVGDTFNKADLAVASLLTPPCRTKKYGIEWPKKYPEPLASTISEYGNKLDWVHRIYDQFR